MARSAEALAREIVRHQGLPQLWVSGNPVAILARRRREVVERPLAASGLERCEVLAAVRQRIEGIALAVEPQHLPWIARPSCEERLIDQAGVDAAGAHPASHEVDDALDLRGVLTRVGDAQDAATRLPADHDTVAVDEGHGEDGSHGGVDVAQPAIGARNREGGVA